MGILFKNWSEICKVKDPHVLAALAWTDLNSDFARKLAAGFPECFSDYEVGGAVPLSVLREYADREALLQGGHSAYDMLESYGATEHFNIPTVEFTTDPYDSLLNPPPLLPAEIDKDAAVGTIIQYQGKSYVVVENNKNPGVNMMILAPADRVDVTC